MHFEVQFARDLQHGVANGLAVEPATIGLPEQFVIAINFCCMRSKSIVRLDEGRHAIRGRCHYEAVNVLEAPTVSHQFGREPIEQFWMCRALALQTEIAGRRYDAAAEVLLPKSIDDYASGQRMIGSREPIG